MAFISLKIGNSGKIGNYDVIVTTYGMLVLFWKEETSIYTMVPNKHNSGVLFFKILVRRVTKIAWFDEAEG